MVTTDQFWISSVCDGVQEVIHAGWAGQRLQYQVYPQAAVSGSFCYEGSDDDDSHGDCHEKYSPTAARCSLHPVQLSRVLPHAGQQQCSQDRQDVPTYQSPQPSGGRASRDGNRSTPRTRSSQSCPPATTTTSRTSVPTCWTCRSTGRGPDPATSRGSQGPDLKQKEGGVAFP